jgi:hypothetical protein
MTENKRRRLYQPPRSVALAGQSARGEAEPLGVCQVGPRPYFNCLTGPGFVGACGTGTLPDTSACNAGAIHTFPACKSGGSAFTGCLSGSGQNF